MAEFHETSYGRRFFEAQLPALIKALEQIALVMTHPPEPRIVPLATQLVHVEHVEYDRHHKRACTDLTCRCGGLGNPER